MTMPAALMGHFASQYGARALVHEYAAQMIATLRKFAAADFRLEVFRKFLSEVKPSEGKRGGRGMAGGRGRRGSDASW